MQGSSPVIDCLKTLLRGELSARDQYFLHARRYWNLGLTVLYQRAMHEMQEETGHADALLQRILFLDGDPDMRPDPFDGGRDVEAMLRKDLATEMHVRGALQAGIALCEAEGDYVSREILLVQLKDTEEDHAHWLEQQLRLIELMGLQNYLQSGAGALGDSA